MIKHKGINQTNAQRELYSRNVSVQHTPFLDISFFLQVNPLWPYAILENPLGNVYFHYLRKFQLYTPLYTNAVPLKKAHYL
jgi:hypothetical protein